ncbi:MAG: hypothetical protein RL682_742, partial [Pseudomonadota bacterium]
MVGIMTRTDMLGATPECEVLCSKEVSTPFVPFSDTSGLHSVLSEHARYAQQVRRRYAEFLAYLPPTVLSHAVLNTCYTQLASTGLAPDAALRVTRALVLERMAVRDCDAQCDLSEVVGAMTTLAEFALDTACQHAQQALDGLHGTPCTPLGQAATLWIVGMGKLGARELNVSSDIDLIYIYDEDGETSGNPEGRGRISNHEYFAKLVRSISTMLADVTEHGFVFRVDLALRPHGNSGPSAVSLEALEDYLVAQGREWERFAWLKSRVVAPTSALASAVQLGKVVLPFVFRKYLDYNVFDALRVLHRQIRDHA